MINGLDHVALSVSDLDRSLKFYCDLLGMKLKRVIEPKDGKGLDTITQMPDCRARIAHLVSGDVMLELFEYQHPRGKPLPMEHKQADKGIVHLGLRSTNVLEDYERLRALDVYFLSEPVEFRAGVWVVYFYGPDGEACELRQTDDE